MAPLHPYVNGIAASEVVLYGLSRQDPGTIRQKAPSSCRECPSGTHLPGP